MMPAVLALVRHGQSEGNVAQKASREGDETPFTDLYRSVSSGYWQLTEKGVEQARTTGRWLRENGYGEFHCGYVSTHVRAMQTAGHLNLSVPWLQNEFLRERERGALDMRPKQELQALFADTMQRRDAHAYFWRPPEGESLADLRMRVDRFLDTLHRERAGQDVIVVCHGEAMRVFEMALERLTPQDFLQLDASKDPKDEIYNGHILLYSRHTDPMDRKSALSKAFTHKRSVCPTDPARSWDAWRPIVRKRWTGEELLKEAETQVARAMEEARQRLAKKG